MAIRTGEQFLAGLRDDREVWLEGERVEDVTTHPKLARMARTLADVYDLQHDPALHDQMTFESPSSGDAVPLSYIIPRTVEDIDRRHRALEIVAASCHGILGRTPDYVKRPGHRRASVRRALRRRPALAGREPRRLSRVHPRERPLPDARLRPPAGQPGRGADGAAGPLRRHRHRRDHGRRRCRQGRETARDAGAIRRRAVLPSVPRGAFRRGHLLPRLLGPRGNAGPQVHLPRELRHGQAAVRPAAVGTVR